MSNAFLNFYWTEVGPFGFYGEESVHTE